MTKITTALIRSLILKRKAKANKGDFGHVLIIAGSRGMAGAAVLCASGALRSGAGLVTAGVPETIEKIVASRLRPEAMLLALPDKKGKISGKAFPKIKHFIGKRKITSIVLGPGLGVNAETRKLVKNIIKNINVPVVLDADGLNVLAGIAGVLKKSKAEIIVTPHPGEMSRLTGIKTKIINSERKRMAAEFSKNNNLVCVLKGKGTLVASGNKVFINTTGNPGMASGGSGDVLSGIISALIKQVKEPKVLNAAVCGVFLHGLAGDLAAKVKTQIGLTAEDIAQGLPKALKKTLG